MVVVGANHTGTLGGQVGSRAGLAVGAASAVRKRPVGLPAPDAGLVVAEAYSY